MQGPFLGRRWITANRLGRPPPKKKQKIKTKNGKNKTQNIWTYCGWTKSCTTSPPNKPGNDGSPVYTNTQSFACRSCFISRSSCFTSCLDMVVKPKSRDSLYLQEAHLWRAPRCLSNPCEPNPGPQKGKGVKNKGSMLKHALVCKLAP